MCTCARFEFPSVVFFTRIQSKLDAELIAIQVAYLYAANMNLMIMDTVDQYRFVNANNDPFNFKAGTKYRLTKTKRVRFTNAIFVYFCLPLIQFDSISQPSSQLIDCCIQFIFFCQTCRIIKINAVNFEDEKLCIICSCKGIGFYAIFSIFFSLFLFFLVAVLSKHSID